MVINEGKRVNMKKGINNMNYDDMSASVRIFPNLIYCTNMEMGWVFIGMAKLADERPCIARIIVMISRLSKFELIWFIQIQSNYLLPTLHTLDSLCLGTFIFQTQIWSCVELWFFLYLPVTALPHRCVMLVQFVCVCCGSGHDTLIQIASLDYCWILF